MNPIKDLWGAFQAKRRLGSVNDQFATNLNNKIAPPGIQGEKNYNKNYGILRGDIDKGQFPQAIQYGKQQGQKVFEQMHPRQRIQGQLNAIQQNIQ